MKMICNAGEQPINIFLSNALSCFLEDSTLGKGFFKPNFIKDFSTQMAAEFKQETLPKHDSPVIIHRKNEVYGRSGLVLKGPSVNLLLLSQEEKEKSRLRLKTSQEKLKRTQEALQNKEKKTIKTTHSAHSAQSTPNPKTEETPKNPQKLNGQGCDSPNRCDQDPKSNMNLLALFKTKPESVLPSINPEFEYTLVLDLDETLIHFEKNAENGGEFLIRPFVSSFLIELSQLFEIVVFTASTQSYADWILDRIDSRKSITHRLYRQHMTSLHKKGFFKDLRLLGRDLSKVIIVDNNPSNFRLQPANGIRIKSWFCDKSDKTLSELCAFLKSKLNQILFY